MSLCRYRTPIIIKRKFNPTPDPTAVAWEALEANGEPGTVSTSQLVFSFSQEPFGINAGNFYIPWASKGTMTGSGLTRTLPIFDLVGDINNTSQIVELLSNPSGYTITPTSLSVVVYKAAALEAPTVANTLTLPQATIGVAYSTNIAYVFGGVVDSYAVATGTLPTWATLNATTGDITGTPDVESTAAGLSFTATNSAGTSPPSSADDLVTLENVDGNGTIVGMTDGFTGHPGLDITGLKVGDIYVQESNNTAPKILICDVRNTRFAGSRRYTTNPVNIWQDAEFKWTVTYENGDAIEYADRELAFDENGDPFNIFTDEIDPRLAVPLRRAGETYKVRVDAYASRADGNLQHDFSEILITPVANELTIECINSVAGNELADGLDMWGDVTLAGATYTEADGYLTEVGAWTSYDHEFSTAGPITRWCNFKYLDGIGLVYIAEKISNDTVRLEDASKLGADQSGITSTSGPKAAIGAIGGKKLFLYPGVYTLNNDLGVTNTTNRHVVCVGAGEVEFRTASGSRMLWTGNNSSASVPDNGFSYIEGARFNAEFVKGRLPIGGTVTSTTPGKISLFLNHVSGVNTKSTYPSNIKNNYTGALDFTILHMGGELNGLDESSGLPYNDKNIHAFYSSKRRGDGYVVADVELKINARDNLLDHYMYPTGDTTGMSFKRLHFSDGSNASYCINLNNANKAPDYETAKWVSVSNCRSDGNSDYFLDASNTGDGSFDSNTEGVNEFESVSVHFIKAKTLKDFSFYNNARDISFSFIEWSSSSTAFRFIRPAKADNERAYYKGVIRNCKAAGTLYRTLDTDTHGGFEIFDNESFQPGSASEQYTIRLGVGQVADKFACLRNNLYSPATLNSVFYGGSRTSVENLNALLNVTGDDVNTAINKGFIDPANNDWSLTPPVPTTFELTFNRTNGAYASFTEVNLTAGEKFRITFKATPQAYRRFLTDRSVGAGTAGTRCPIEFDTGSLLKVLPTLVSLITIDGTTVTPNQYIQSYMDDQFHTIELTIAAGQTATFGNIGSAYTNSNYFDDVLKDVEFDKFVEGTLTTVLKWNVDSGSVTTEPSVIGTANLTFVNVFEGDWSAE